MVQMASALRKLLKTVGLFWQLPDFTIWPLSGDDIDERLEHCLQALYAVSWPRAGSQTL